MDSISTLLEEAINEGLMDKLRGAVGLKNKGQFELIPKEEWETLIKDNRQLVNMFANTPGIGDAYDLAKNVLQALDEQGCLEAKRVAQSFRIALKNLKKDNRDQEAKKDIIRIVKGLQKEADQIRTVRTAHGLRRESIEEIASVISEDIRYNNGLIL
jgi:uncharacterized protein with von Willebrand factor type A (vWA) domain